MTITLELPEDLAQQLKADAQAQGRTPEDLATEAVAALYAQDDLDTALEEAFAQMETGQSIALEAAAQELRARLDTGSARAADARVPSGRA